jgi:hypothetical protein
MKKVSITRGDTAVFSIEVHDPEFNIVVHDAVSVKPEIKPHQFEEGKDYFVECTPAQRTEIIRVAQSCGITVHRTTFTKSDSHPNICFDKDGDLCGGAPREKYPNNNWIPFNEFVARLKGEWVEPKPEPDYSNCIGKFVRCIESMSERFTVNKWYKCVANPMLTSAFIDDIGVQNGWVNNYQHFDFSNPLDYNPDEPKEVRIPFSADRMHEAIRYETEGGDEITRVVVNDVKSDYPVSGYGLSRGAYSWTIHGRYQKGIMNHMNNLFMWVKEGGQS